MELLIVIVCILAVIWWYRVKSKSDASGSTVIDLSILPERFVVLDLETTGLNPERNKILEVAAIRVNRESNVHETFQALVKIKGKVPARITEITGITDEMIKNEGKPLDEVLEQFVAFVGDLRLISFNAPFDMGFLSVALKAKGIELNNPVSCALDMARRAFPKRKSYKLAALAEDGNLGQQCHRALEDCRLALHVYVAAANRLRRVD